MVYANPKVSAVQIPENSTSDSAYDSYRGGKQVSSYTSGELTSHAENLYKNHFSGNSTTPVFMSVNLETPFALSAFLGNNANFQKVYIPATYNMSKILESLSIQ